MNTGFYDRALRRIERLTVVVGAVGVLAALAKWGPRAAAGFMVGAVISLVNYQLLRHLANSLGQRARPSVRGAALLFAVRYLLIAGVVYGIVRILGISLGATLVGLLAVFGAVILEILYELIFHARA